MFTTSIIKNFFVNFTTNNFSRLRKHISAPYGTRTRVLALRGLRPRPLDERGLYTLIGIDCLRILANGRISVKELLISSLGAVKTRQMANGSEA